MEETNEIYSRQLGLIHPDRLNFPITIIGAGSIGSWTALCLAKMGCTVIDICDDDKIEPHNIPNQFYKVGQEGLKADALQELVKEFTHATPTIDLDRAIEGTIFFSGVVISAVDNMETRKKLFESHKGLHTWLIDGRMGGNAIEIYTVRLDNQEQCEAYEKTLFSDENALPVPCSHRSVAYNGLTIAGYISSVVAKIALEQEVPSEIMIDMQNYLLLK